MSLPSPPMEEPANNIHIDDTNNNNSNSNSNSNTTNISDEKEQSSAESFADPFAPREGKTLTWRNVNMTLTPKGKAPGRKILDNVWGRVPKQQTAAIMGPSGSGKTSLLNILAGRASSTTTSHGGSGSSSNTTTTSDIRLDHTAVNPATNMAVRRMIAFVAQDDGLNITSTPREAIYFSAKLRLPARTTTEAQLERLTSRVLTELGLTECADTMIGGGGALLLQGISGGERKRTAVGVELVVKPAVIFLDEPTSGLDSFSALQLFDVLKQMARAGSSVLFTIHQPSSEIFNALDHLILLHPAGGRVLYQGPVSHVPSYFGQRGHPHPPYHHNPADHIMKVAQSTSLDELERQGFFAQDGDELKLGPPANNDWTESKTAKLGVWEDQPNGWDEPGPGLLVQIQLLFQREIRGLRRNKASLKARFGLTTTLSSLIGCIFFQVATKDFSRQANLQSTFGAIIMVLFMSMFGTAMPSLLAFPAERPVFLREYSTNHYSVMAYFASRLTMEAFITALQMLLMTNITYWMIGFQMKYRWFFLGPYSLAMASTALAVTLGCSVNETKLATEMLPMLFVPQVLFAGFFVAPSLMPPWLRWARYCCPLTYAVRIYIVNEFYNCNPDNAVANENCNKLVAEIDADPDDVWWNWAVLVSLFLFFRITALAILRRKSLRYY